MYGKTYRNCVKADESKDPKAGTGKKTKRMNKNRGKK